MAPPYVLAAMTDIARGVGDMALARWKGEGGDYKVWDKTPGNPVSDIDIAADQALRDRLAMLDSQAGWLSEEAVDHPARLDCRRIWCVDPIDGTRDFVRGRTGWAVSIALVEDGAPLAGVLYAPARGEMWSAYRGGGAKLNGAPVTVAECSSLTGARVPADHLASEDKALAMVAKPNSIALRIAMVASGAADLVATLRWGYEWDIAAASLIASEAGAKVSDAFGGKLGFNKRDPRAFGVLISAPGIHNDAVALLSERAQRIAPVTDG